MKLAAALNASPMLEAEIAKPLQQHGTIQGWVALDSMRHAGLTPGQIFFRIKLTDTAKRGGTYVAELPRKQPGDSSLDVNVGSIQVLGMRTDISRIGKESHDLEETQAQLIAAAATYVTYTDKPAAWEKDLQTLFEIPRRVLAKLTGLHLRSLRAILNRARNPHPRHRVLLQQIAKEWRLGLLKDHIT